MTLLIAGLVLFLGVHLIKPVLPAARQHLVERLGDGPYKGIYSLISAVGLGLIIFGYMQAEYVWLWAPLPGSPYVTHGLMLPAAMLLMAPYIPNSWGRRVQHPMLLGTLLWGVAHLWSNGHLKATLLFGGFALFAVIDASKQNWNKTIVPKSLISNLIWIVVSLVVYGAIRYIHTI